VLLSSTKIKWNRSECIKYGKSNICKTCVSSVHIIMQKLLFHLPHVHIC
jgi:hypothetical protein